MPVINMIAIPAIIIFFDIINTSSVLLHYLYPDIHGSICSYL